MTDALRVQYEAYPYPSRDPVDEDRRLVTGSPSRLDQLNHYVFGGRLDFTAPLRVLVAGGGTGDATIMLGQQLRDAGVPAEIVCLDLSGTALEIAGARSRRRGLTGIGFHRASLLDLEPAGWGRFDYIDCCGVLHHLESPAAGLLALAAALALAPSICRACACGCGLYEVGTNSMIPIGAGVMTYVEYDYQDQDHNWSGA